MFWLLVWLELIWIELNNFEILNEFEMLRRILKTVLRMFLRICKAVSRKREIYI